MRSAYRLCAAGTVVLLVYAVLLSLCSVAGFPTAPHTAAHWPWLGNKPVGEDGFYMLTVADNIARSGHIVYNYGHPATGIQPLSTFVFAGIAWLVHRMRGGEWALVRAMILEGSLLFVCFAWGMASFVSRLGPRDRRAVLFVLGFFLTLLDYDLFRLFTYGLETGIYLCLEIMCLWLSMHIMQAGKSSWPQALLLGGAGGFAGLARIDFGILFAILLCWMLVRRVLSPVQMLCCGLIALAITSPWFAFVHSVSGAWLPSSGSAEGRLFHAHDANRFIFMARAIVVHLCPWVYSTLPQQYFVPLGAVSLAAMLTLFVRSSSVRAWLMAPGGYLRNAAPWIAGILALVATYVLFFSVTTFYVRYISLLFLLAMPVLAVLLAEQPAIAARPALAIIPLAAFFSFYCGATLHTGFIGNNWLIDAGYIHRYYPDAHAASFQSGTIGYFDRNVDNLDGKLNGDALKALKSHTMAAYLDRAGINVLVEWPSYIERELPADYVTRVWRPCPYPMYPTGGVCLVRRSVSPASGR